MGHERVGYLPKTQKWRVIVESIGNLSDGNTSVATVAVKTITTVRSRYNNIEQDKGVLAAFKYIILLSQACKLPNYDEYLSDHGIKLRKGFNIFDLTQSIQTYVLGNTESKEYSTFAIQSMIDTVTQWTKVNSVQQSFIFDTDSSSIDLWKKAANGAGFCELSRLFFSKFTERYLKYFLEREASLKISTVYERSQFNKNLENYVSNISKHAFETAKIVESFSAGWYNGNVKDDIPSDSKIQGFLSFAFQKLNSELLREENRD